MNRNLPWHGRTIRFLIGVTTVAWAIAGGPLWAYLGIYFLATAGWGFCPVRWVVSPN